MTMETEDFVLQLNGEGIQVDPKLVVIAWLKVNR
jgi:preprotein translocase subunit Sec61beta